MSRWIQIYFDLNFLIFQQVKVYANKNKKGEEKNSQQVYLMMKPRTRKMGKHRKPLLSFYRTCFSSPRCFVSVKQVF